MPELGFLRSLVRADRPESPQLLTLLIAALALVVGLAATIGACVWWIIRNGDLGWGAVVVFFCAVSALGILAGYSQRFQMPGLPIGPAGPIAPDAAREPSVDRGTHQVDL